MECYIELTKCKRAIVDEEFYQELNRHKWYAVKAAHSTVWYAKRSQPKSVGGQVAMHQQVLSLAGVVSSLLPDHINGDGLDNRLQNLRLANESENRFNRGPQRNNTSGYKGVCFDRKRGKWMASIMARGKRKHIGRFETAVSAAAAYNEAAICLHGEFARLNKI